MKKAILPALASAAILFVPALDAAAATVSFTGEIVSGACGIDAGSIDQTVKLGAVPTHRFKATGDRSAAQSFDIRLTDCDTTIAKNAFFTFTGAANAAEPSLFGTVGGATNVGVRLQSASGEIISNGVEAASPVVMADGANLVRFGAMYEATAANVTPGDADTVVNFKVRYQ